MKPKILTTIFALLTLATAAQAQTEIARIKLNGVDALYCYFDHPVKDGVIHLYKQGPEDPPGMLRRENFICQQNANPSIFLLSRIPQGFETIVNYIANNYIQDVRVLDVHDSNLPFKELNFPVPTGIKLSQEAITLKVGERATVIASAIPEDAFDIFWWDIMDHDAANIFDGTTESGNGVSGGGFVDAKRPGTAVFTVKGKTSGLTATCTVTVVEDKTMFDLFDNDSEKLYKNKQYISDHLDMYMDNVKLDGRTLYRDGRWNTLCLPFDLWSFAGTPLEGATVKRLASSNYDATTNTLTLNFTDDTTISAGTPYIVRWTSGDSIVNPVFSGVRFNSSSSYNSWTQYVDFVGCYSSVPLKANDRTVLYMGGDSKLYYPGSNMNVNAFRGYFQLKNGLTAGDLPNEAKTIVMNFGDGETTTIGASLNDKGQMINDDDYSIDGRKLSGEPTKKGVYIVNGKKVVK